MGPDFIVIGAQKAGTTWLDRNLRSHPGIWLPPEKELHYFDGRFPRRSWRQRLTGQSKYDRRWRRQVRHTVRRAIDDRDLADLKWRVPWLLGARDDAWYARLFPDNGLVTGECTPAYAVLSSDRVASIAKQFPDLRLVLLVRNPIEWMWSAAAQREREGDRIDDPDAMVARAGLRLRSNYVAMLDTWLAHFSPKQLYVGFMEDIQRHPRGLIDRVTEHLGLPQHDRYPHAGVVIHRGHRPTMPAHFAVGLARGLVDDIDAAAERLGGPARFWSYAAHRLASHEGDEPVELPLDESWLWDDWVATGNAGEDPRAFGSARADQLPLR